MQFRSKSKSAKKRNISRSPLQNNRTLKTPSKVNKNRSSTPEKKSPWKL